MKIDLLPTSREGKLARLVEECAEVIKAVSKGQRFGWAPTSYEGVDYDNNSDLYNEMQDLEHAISAVRNIDLNPRKPL